MSFSLAVKKKINFYSAWNSRSKHRADSSSSFYFSLKKENNNLEFLIYSSEVAGITKPSILQKILPQVH